MTSPLPPKLSLPSASLLEHWGAGIVVFLFAIGAAYLSGTCNGAKKAADRQDSLHSQQLHDSLTVLERQLPALQAKAAKVDSLVALTVKPHEVAKATTDTMGAHEASARAKLEAVLADSLAKLADVRQAALDLAVSDSLARLAVLKERNAANARIMALTNQHSADSTLLAKDAETIHLSAQTLAAEQQVEKDLRAQQPNVIHRAVRGVLTVAAGGACGGLGLLASPLVAFGGAIACGAIVGAVLH